MVFQTLGKLLFQTLCLALAKRLGALLLGSLVLWQVTEHAGATRGQAIIHVATPQVEVIVDAVTYSVESLWDSPLVCDLRPGRHRVRMRREGRTLYEEEFRLAAGEEVILTAWDGYDDGRSPTGGEQDTQLESAEDPG